MRNEKLMWRNALLALAAAALFITGLGVIIYVGIARDRIVPTPTPTLVRPTAVPEPSDTAVVSSSPTVFSTSPSLPSVMGTVREYSPGALIIVITPIEGSVEQIIVPENLEITWVNGRRASPKDIVIGETVYAEGEIDSLGRMIAQRLVIMHETAQVTETPTPVVSPSIVAVPTQPTAAPGAWMGEYYANPTLSGSPAVVREDPEINFQWALGSPASGIPTDGFSVRWRGRRTLSEGGYRFYAYSDDGVRLWVNGALVIDQWRDQSPTMSTGTRYLKAGEYDIQVEYYEGVANAQIRVWWDYKGPYPDWKGDYYDNPNLAGDPVVVRNDADIHFDWGADAPVPEMPADGFSVRWRRTVDFEEGAYRFDAEVDDGIRVRVDGVQIIDGWKESRIEPYVGYIWLSKGLHNVHVEYLEMAGDASVDLWWSRVTSYPHWKGEYYTNPDLAGDPAFVVDDEEIAFNWDVGSPRYGIPADNFSVRWTRTLAFDEGSYTFWAMADDGVRLYLDDELLIDEWHDSPATRYEKIVALDAGDHTIVVEYYERGGQALAAAGWERDGTPTPTLTYTPSPSPTATGTPQPTLTPQLTRTPTETPVLATTTPTATTEPATATNTAVPPTATWTPAPTETETLTPEPTMTETVVEPTATSTQTAYP